MTTRYGRRRWEANAIALVRDKCDLSSICWASFTLGTCYPCMVEPRTITRKGTSRMASKTKTGVKSNDECANDIGRHTKEIDSIHTQLTNIFSNLAQLTEDVGKLTQRVKRLER